jgi:cell division septal protein FtsQ
MKRTIKIQLKSKSSPRQRRSQTRLGKKPAVLETSLPKNTFAIKPAVNFWQGNRARLIGGMIVVLMIWVTYLVFDSDDFYVYRARIQGNRILSAAEIYAASQVDGLSVFWIDPEAVAGNVEALPNVKRAYVHLTLPANLIIEVEERQPEIIWQTGEEMWWIDNEGLFVPPHEEADAENNRLRIIDQEVRAIQPNDQIDLGIVRGAQIIHEHKPELETLYYSQQYGLTYLTPEGWPVYVGKKENIRAKLRAADSIYADLAARQVSPLFIDVRNPLRAIYEEPQIASGF